ncbi:MAG: hypothetical protein OEZ34_07890 [Spirochaetia bacterium]|nr:hypothetical protein [Spirochaetia bacterium]
MYTLGSKKDIKISEEENGFEVWQIGQEHSHDFTSLAIKSYIMNSWIGEKDVEKMYLEDVRYAPHGIFLAIKHRNSPDILATFRLVKKEGDIRFPFQDFFGLSIEDLCDELKLKPPEIWHGGRIVVDKDKLEKLGFKKNYSVALIWNLFYHVYRLITGFENNLFIGENYLPLHRFYSITLGIKMIILKKKEYFPGAVSCASYIIVKDLIKNFNEVAEKIEMNHKKILRNSASGGRV